MDQAKLLKALEVETSAKEDEILGRARMQAEKLLKMVRKDAEQVRLAADRDVHLERERMHARELAAVDLKVRTEALHRERRDLDALKAALLDELAALPAERRRGLVAALAAQAKKELESESTPLMAGGASLVFESLPEDRAAIESVGGMKFAGGLSATGGIIVRTVDGSVSCNMTYEKMVEEFWRDAVKEAASMLKW